MAGKSMRSRSSASLLVIYGAVPDRALPHTAGPQPVPIARAHLLLVRPAAGGRDQAGPQILLPVDPLLDLRDGLAYPAGGDTGIARLDGAANPARRPLGDLTVMRDLSGPGPGGPIPLRLFDARESRAAGPLVLFLHGGGFVLGDLDSHESICAEIARQLDLPLLAVDYRLAPEHPWPAGIEDAIAAAYWAAGSPAELGREVTGLVPCGDSAGGNFAIIVSLALRDTPAAVPVIAQFPIYPAANPGEGYPSYEDFAEG